VPLKPLEARYSRFHNASMAAVSLVIVGAAIGHFIANPERAPNLSFNDSRFVLFVMLAVAMGFYAWLGLSRFVDRTPHVIIDHDGIALGFGRNQRFAWDDIEWARLRRIALRPQLQIGLAPARFVEANLRLSTWNLDDGLRPVRGMPAGLNVRDNGLDVSAAAMLEAVRRFRPNLVKP
jgi:hypothetical protein